MCHVSISHSRELNALNLLNRDLMMSAYNSEVSTAQNRIYFREELMHNSVAS